MNSSPSPIVKDLVLIGGGHSHIAVLKRFGMKPIPGVRITLITRDVHTPYSGMLPGYIAGHYTFDETHIDLRPLSLFAKARLFHSRATHIDFENKEVHCDNRPPVRYDALSINIGSRPEASKITGADEFALPVKPIDRFLKGWERILADAEEREGDYQLTVVGGGAGGVEMALACQYHLRNNLDAKGFDRDRLKVSLISASDILLPTHNPRVSQTFDRVTRERGIEVVKAKQVMEVTANSVILEDGQERQSDATLWVTNAWAQPWPGASGLETDDRGFIKVKDTLQSLSHPEVFACGDIASVVDYPREKSGVFAVRQGPPLTENLRRFLLGKTPKPYKPQKAFLGLISTGDQYAVASHPHYFFEGPKLWKWKDWIDRRFMEKFSDLPAMEEAHDPGYDTQLAGEDARRELSAIAMRCGGCGAKVGSTVLSRVVNRLETQTRDDVVIGLDSPDDAAVLQVPPGKVMVQSVDYFRAFIDDAYLFGQIAANHALGDVFAMGAEAQSALAIATLPYGRESIVEDQLYQLMSGALSVLNESGTALVGGHSSEGAELAFGLTVNGIGDPDTLLRKGGMTAGQAIILTKPLGTGTIMAADMRSKAKGRWVHAALDSMRKSNLQGAQILQQHGCTACTDVTGFGLLGHLVEMTKASGVDAIINANSIPQLAGAIACIEAGVTSSLQPQNLRLRRAVRDNGFDRESALFALLFDPQTAGGLLATVPEDQASACVDALQSNGFPATAIIGSVETQSDALEPIILESR